MSALGDQLKKNLSRAAYDEYNGRTYVDAQGETQTITLDPINNPNISENYTNAFASAIEEYVGGDLNLVFDPPEWGIPPTSTSAVEEEGNSAILDIHPKTHLKWLTPAEPPEWSSIVSYVVDDLVQQTGVCYKCIQDNLNQDPAIDNQDEVPTYWMPLQALSAQTRIYRAKRNVDLTWGAFALLATVPDSIIEYDDETSSFNNTYRYLLSFVTLRGRESEFSTSQDVATDSFPVPDTVSTPAALTTGTGQIQLELPDVGTDASLVSYSIELRSAIATEDGKGEYTVPQDPQWGAWSSFSELTLPSKIVVHTNVSPARVYQYRFRIRNKWNNLSGYSDLSDPVIPLKTTDLTDLHRLSIVSSARTALGLFGGRNLTKFFMMHSSILPNNHLTFGWLSGDNALHNGQFWYQYDTGAFYVFDSSSGEWDPWFDVSSITWTDWIDGNGLILAADKSFFSQTWDRWVFEKYVIDSISSKLENLVDNNAYVTFSKLFLSLENFFLDEINGILIKMTEDSTVDRDSVVALFSSYQIAKQELLRYYAEDLVAADVPSGIFDRTYSMDRFLSVNDQTIEAYLAAQGDLKIQVSTDLDLSWATGDLKLLVGSHTVKMWNGSSLIDIACDLGIFFLTKTASFRTVFLVRTVGEVPTTYTQGDVILIGSSANVVSGGKTFLAGRLYVALKNSNSAFVASDWGDAVRYTTDPNTELSIQLSQTSFYPSYIHDLLIPLAEFTQESIVFGADQLYRSTANSITFEPALWENTQKLESETSATSVQGEVQLVDSEDCITPSEKMDIEEEYTSLTREKTVLFSEIDNYYPTLQSSESAALNAYNQYHDLLYSVIDGLLNSMSVTTTKSGIWYRFTTKRANLTVALSDLKALLDTEKAVHGVVDPGVISSEILPPTMSLSLDGTDIVVHLEKNDTNSSSLRKYEIQVCADSAGSPDGNWYPLEIDGTGWKDTEFDGEFTAQSVGSLWVTQTTLPQFIHSEIPLSPGDSLKLWYRSRCSIVGRASAWSSSSSIEVKKPAKATNITAVAHASTGPDVPEKIIVSWDDMSGLGIILYIVQYSKDEGVSWIDLATVSINSYIHTLVGYHEIADDLFVKARYRIIPINNFSVQGDTPTNINEWATPNTGSFGSYVPGNIDSGTFTVSLIRVAGQANGGRLVVDWVAPENSSLVDYYVLQYTHSYSSDGWTKAIELRVSDTSFLDYYGELANSSVTSDFKYRLKAHNSITGNLSAAWVEPGSYIATGSDDYLLTDSITGLIATALRSGAQVYIDVSWTAYAGVCHEDVESYELLFTTDNWVTSSVVYQGSISSFRHLLSGQFETAGFANYKYKVRAISAFGTPRFMSGFSIASVTTTSYIGFAISSTYTAAPTLAATMSKNSTSEGDVKIAVTWTAVTPKDGNNRTIADSFVYVLLECDNATWSDSLAREIYRGNDLAKTIFLDAPSAGSTSDLSSRKYKIKIETEFSSWTQTTAVNIGGTIDFTLPGTPTAPTAVSIRELTTVSWTAYSGTNSADVIEYELYESINSGSSFKTDPVYIGTDRTWSRSTPVAEEFATTAGTLRYKVLARSKYLKPDGTPFKSVLSSSSTAPSSTGYLTYIPESSGITISGKTQGESLVFNWNKLDNIQANREVDAYLTEFSFDGSNFHSLGSLPSSIGFADLFSSDLWSVSGATKSLSGGLMTVTSTSGDPTFYRNNLSFEGKANRYIYLYLRKTVGSATNGTVFYSTSGHVSSASYCKSFTLPLIAAGWTLLKIDMGALTVGGTDWLDNTILGLRFDFTDTNGDATQLDWMLIGGDVLADYVKSNSLQIPLPVNVEGSVIQDMRLRVTPKTIFGISAASPATQSVDIDTSSLGTYIPAAITLQASAFKRSVTLKWDDQANLLEKSGYLVQISVDNSNWYKPSVSISSETGDTNFVVGTPATWSEGAGYQVVPDNTFTIPFLPVGLVSGSPNPGGQLYYFRVYRITKSALGSGVTYNLIDGVTSKVSTSVSTTVLPTLTKDVAAGQIAQSLLAQGSGVNVIPYNYCSYENYDVGRAFTARNTGVTATVSNEKALDGLKSLKIATAAGVTDGWLYLSENNSSIDYFIPVEESSLYMISFYVYALSIINLDAYAYRSGSVGVGSIGNQSIPAGVWTRVNFIATIPAGCTAINLRIDDDTASSTMYVDCIQAEKIDSTKTEPSSWRPTGMTSVNGGLLLEETVHEVAIAAGAVTEEKMKLSRHYII